MSQLSIWTNFPRNDAERAYFTQAIAPHQSLFGKGPGADSQLQGAQIAFGQPDPQQVIDLTNLRWIQISSAGYTRYDNDELRAALKARQAVMTNSSSVFDEPCAQHLLAMMLSMTRQLPAALDNQRSDRSWTVDQVRARSTLLKGQHVLLVGYGAIATRLAEMLEPFRVEIIGVRRRPRGDERVHIVPIDEIDRHLPWADHVVNILPLSDSTHHLFNADRFAAMKPSALFYNIGRGRTVDQDALRRALETNEIAAAYLDVTTPEPLPSDDPLWTTPNCHITPHTGGGFHGERTRQMDHFINNLKRYEHGEAMVDRVV